MRRSKEEAAQTRAAIVEAALAVFDRHGIAGSTIEQVARQAGVTKGAVYHHFDGKGALLREIRDRVTLPLLDEADTELLRGGDMPALERIEHFMLRAFEHLHGDPFAGTALRVMQFKCEYVNDLEAELAGGVRAHERLIKAFEAAYAEARKAGEMRAGFAPRMAALDTVMFFGGLVKLWLLHGPRSRVRRETAQLIHCHVALRRA